MSSLSKWISLVLGLLIMGLLLYPFTVQPGSPYRVEHESRKGAVTSGQQGVFDLRLLNRELNDAKKEVANAKSQRDRAYLPTSPLFENTRQNRINRAQGALDNATSQLNDIKYKIYIQKRIQESEARERKLDKMREIQKTRH